MKHKVVITAALASPLLFVLTEYVVGIVSGKLCWLLLSFYVPSIIVIAFILRKNRLLLLPIILFISVSSTAQRCKIGLALGGGGAKGAATIGILKIIEEADVRIDYIAGSSIGALIGGLYASGYTTTELEELMLSQDWETILSGYRVERLLDELLAKHRINNITDTKIPFRCVAVDYNTMTEVVLSSGSLAKAMRASMSIPEVYEPVRWGDKRLVDGGVLNNLPVDVVKAMGADKVIAVDLQQGEGMDFGYSTGLGGLIDWAIRRPDAKKHQCNVEVADVYIHPDLHIFNAMNFDRNSCELMVRKGRNEAMHHWEELIRLKNK